MRASSIVLALWLATLLAACAQTQSLTRDQTFTRPAGATSVLVMEADVEVAELTAAGLLEPNAQWTSSAKTHIAEALASRMAKSEARVVAPRELENATVEHPHVQLIKLDNAVAGSILLHKYVPGFELPTKEEGLGYSLGPGAAALRDAYGTDYALFVFFRDSITSPGRVAVIFLGALMGVAVPGGQQSGFASLVDLRTGDLLWFNRLVGNQGDLREADGSRAAVDQLLDGFPL